MLKKINLISLLLSLICLILWVFGFQFISFIIMLIGWIIIIRDYPLGKKIGHTSWAITFFIIFFIISSFRIFELRTDFAQPCWSPDGKQIAFFMKRSLFRVQPGVPFSAWTSIDLWKKYYLCTMDYDGKNFKQIKEIGRASEKVSWSGSGKIVYSIGNKMWSFDPNTLQETKLIDNVEGYVLDPWLSKDQKYLGYVLYYRVPYIAKDGIERQKDKYRLVIKDMKADKEKLVIDQKYEKYVGYGKLYGSYDENLIIYEESGENKWVTYNLDTGKQVARFYSHVSSKIEDIKLLPATLDMRTISPDRSMDTEDVFRYYNKKYGIERTKRSYLINIFWK